MPDMKQYLILVNHEQKAAIEAFIRDYTRRPDAMGSGDGVAVYTNPYTGHEVTAIELLRLLTAAKETN